MYCEECGKDIKEPNEQGDFICEEMDKRGISYDLEHPYTK